MKTELDALAFALRVIDAPRCPACQKRPVECRCAHWCAECACWTNHTTRQHQEAAAEGPQET